MSYLIKLAAAVGGRPRVRDEVAQLRAVVRAGAGEALGGPRRARVTVGERRGPSGRGRRGGSREASRTTGALAQLRGLIGDVASGAALRVRMLERDVRHDPIGGRG